MKFNLILIFSLTINLAIAQEPRIASSCKFHYDLSLKRNIYDNVDQPPLFPGGPAEVPLFILKNVKFFDCENRKGINAAIVVDTTGYVIDRSIVNKNKSKHTKNEREILRVLKLMPRWQPGCCDGKKVPVRVLIPLH